MTLPSTDLSMSRIRAEMGTSGQTSLRSAQTAFGLGSSGQFGFASLRGKYIPENLIVESAWDYYHWQDHNPWNGIVQDMSNPTKYANIDDNGQAAWSWALGSASGGVGQPGVLRSCQVSIPAGTYFFSVYAERSGGGGSPAGVKMIHIAGNNLTINTQAADISLNHTTPIRYWIKFTASAATSVVLVIGHSATEKIWSGSYNPIISRPQLERTRGATEPRPWKRTTSR